MTIIDVAREAQVSKSTVSNYLSGAHHVSADKCARIEKAIQKLGYIPSQPARLLRQDASREIGVIFPDFENPHYVQILKGLETIFREEGYQINVSISQNSTENEKSIINQYVQKRVRGIALVTSLVEDEAFFQNTFRNRTIPIVFMEREIKNLLSNFVCVDYEDILLRITRRCLRQGRRSIALLCNHQGCSEEMGAIRGFTRAHQELDMQPGLVCATIASKENAFMVTVDLVSASCPQVIITTAQHHADAVVKALRICGKREEVEVISLGDDVWCKPSMNQNGYLLTQRPSIALGKAAANALIAQIQSPYTHETQRIVLKDHFAFAEEQSVPRVNVLSSVSPGRPLRVVMVETGCSKTVEKLLPAFENTTGLKAQLDLVPLNGYFQTLLEKQHSDHPYDVLMVDMPWIGIFADNGLISDLSDLARPPLFDKSIYLPQALEALSAYRDRMWGLPLYCMAQTLYYRKDLFEDPALAKKWKEQTNLRLRPPRTWAEFNALAAFFTRSVHPSSPTQYGASIPGAYPECLSTEILARMNTTHARLFDRYARPSLHSSEMLAACHSLLKTLEYCPPDCMNKDRDDVIRDFLDGSAAMILTFQSLFPAASKELFSDKVGIAGTPGNLSLLGGWSLCISSGVKERDAAFSFINWACGEQTADTMAILTGQTVIRRILENDEFNHTNPWMTQYSSQYTNAYPLYAHYINKGKIVSNLAIDKILFEVVHKAYSGETTLEKALEYGQEEMKKIIRPGSWKL